MKFFFCFFKDRVKKKTERVLLQCSFFIFLLPGFFVIDIGDCHFYYDCSLCFCLKWIQFSQSSSLVPMYNWPCENNIWRVEKFYFLCHRKWLPWHHTEQNVTIKHPGSLDRFKPCLLDQPSFFHREFGVDLAEQHAPSKMNKVMLKNRLKMK